MKLEKFSDKVIRFEYVDFQVSHNCVEISRYEMYLSLEMSQYFEWTLPPSSGDSVANGYKKSMALEVG